MAEHVEWHPVRIKRRWIPEWLWCVLGQAPVRQPMRWITTRAVAAEDALRYWSETEDDEDGHV